MLTFCQLSEGRIKLHKDPSTPSPKYAATMTRGFSHYMAQYTTAIVQKSKHKPRTRCGFGEQTQLKLQ